MRAVKDTITYSDEDLINMLKDSNDALAIVYKKHKDYCFNFMKAMYNDNDTIQDIYQDATIVFYESVNKPNFILSCSIQTYLNSICRNQILVRIKHSNRYEVKSSEENSQYIENLTDWFEEVGNVNNDRIAVMKTVLKEMKDSANKCYDMLVRFFYQNQTMDKIAIALSYNGADVAKNQKYRCIEKAKQNLKQLSL